MQSTNSEYGTPYLTNLKHLLFQSETEFVNTHRDKLIERVSSVMAIADSLKSKDMINGEMYSKVHAAEPREEKMRLLLDALDSGGAAVKAEFCRLLKEKERYLVNELGPHL
uniref:CARD domain-containing protein n=1 Tax=Sinocyclocheilus grahami TaxID=75366 RepID=A0A672RL35_SINGR